MNRLVAKQEEWDQVVTDLEAENLKLMSYDKTLVAMIDNPENKNILDYGAGPGVLALAMSKLGGNIKVWDINSEMREKSSQRIGKNNIYSNIEDIPKNYFDVIICNLVLCIIPEDTVTRVVNDIQSQLKDDGFALIGFCNPKIFNVKESSLDLRFPTGESYETNHQYKKIKKEGGYEIIEDHRPINWYEKTFIESGFKVVEKNFTPEYNLNGNKIEDFIIFKLSK